MRGGVGTHHQCLQFVRPQGLVSKGQYADVHREGGIEVTVLVIDDGHLLREGGERGE